MQEVYPVRTCDPRKNAMESGDKEYEILVDNVVAKENVSRFATHQGYQVQATEQGDDILLKLTK